MWKGFMIMAAVIFTLFPIQSLKQERLFSVMITMVESLGAVLVMGFAPAMWSMMMLAMFPRKHIAMVPGIW
ncbi:hypothetical protein A11A3_16632 [Alcanivorax hongdengensis A-11-3]|uniref:Uncharacterized protein n=1 Tax=Alcanivorax hongdengensis A-11-3 TaxID=1177179 RepID=L0W7G9_9GAMM|nr:hypothetical protein A11A3_16632 [Alcanivorax hongdengensis A-11-3]